MAIYQSDKNYANRKADSNKKYLVRQFSKSVNFQYVKLHKANGSVIEDYPIRIGERNYKESKAKIFETHPSYPLEYGDIIEALGNEILMVEQISLNRDINTFGTLSKCFDKIKWENNNTLYEEYIFINNSTERINSKGDLFITDGSKITLLMQSTDNSNQIKINQDFILGNNFKRVYKLLTVDDFSLHGILKMTFKVTEESAKDDLDNNVAYNPDSVESPTRVESSLNDSYYLIAPKDDTARYMSLKQYTVEHYNVDDIEIVTNFNYEILNLNSDLYELDILDNNTVNFTSKVKEGNATLQITDTDASEIININIELIGLW